MNQNSYQNTVPTNCVSCFTAFILGKLEIGHDGSFLHEVHPYLSQGQPHMTNLTLLKRDGSLLVHKMANPEQAEALPRFRQEERAERTHRL